MARGPVATAGRRSCLPRWHNRPVRRARLAAALLPSPDPGRATLPLRRPLTAGLAQGLCRALSLALAAIALPAGAASAQAIATAAGGSNPVSTLSATGLMGLVGVAAVLGAGAALAGVALASRLRHGREFKQLQAQLAAAAHWIWRCDQDGRITDIAALRATSPTALDLAAARGKSLWQLLAPQAVCPAELQQALATRQAAGPLLLQHNRRVLALALTPAASGTGFAGTALDLGSLGGQLQDLGAAGSNAQPLERQRQLELAARELDSFAHSVSHDLRAPLRVVDGFAAILLEDYADARKPLDDLGREHIRRIIAAGSRMNSMIDTLLSMSRMTAAELTRERVSITHLAQELADELRATDRSRRVQFVIGEQLSADGDRTLLRLVLQNLMGNAFKFTGKVNPARIEVGSDTSGPTAVFFVRDNGAGFDMRFADKLFGVFQRFHSANEFPGTGVGLATVQRIIRKHGGRIWAESQPGAGATFFFTLWDIGRTT
jgi:signal transduction histidine kinase